MYVLLIIGGLVLIWLGASLRHVPADPPHIAVVVFLGRRLREIKEEGYRLFPFYPFLYSAILINMRKRSIDFPPRAVRTSDLSEVEISVSVTWTPSRRFAIEFLDNSNDEAVNGDLQRMIEERLRQWALSGDWIQALSVKDEAAYFLTTSLFGLKAETKEEQKEQLVATMRAGTCNNDIPSLGIELNRLIVGQVKPKGDLAVVAERMAREVQSIRGLKIKTDFVEETALKITKALNCSPQQAIDLIQSESGTVTRRINDMRISVSDETLALVSKLVAGLRSA